MTDLGVCGAPALYGGGGHVSPNRKPARAYRRPRGRPVYRMFLAPLIAALTTLKHCQLGHCCPVRVHDGVDDVAKQEREPRGASTESSSGKSYGES